MNYQHQLLFDGLKIYWHTKSAFLGQNLLGNGKAFEMLKYACYVWRLIVVQNV